MKNTTDNSNNTIERKVVLKQPLALRRCGGFFNAIIHCWHRQILWYNTLPWGV